MGSCNFPTTPGDFGMLFTEAKARQGSGKRIVSLLTAQTKSEVNRVQGYRVSCQRGEKNS